MENTLRAFASGLFSRRLADHLDIAGERSEVVNSVSKAADSGEGASSSRPSPSAGESQSSYAKQLSEVPELAEYGPVLKSSSKPVELTESETEYVVACVKHVFTEHIVFQVRFLFRAYTESSS